MHRFRFDLSLNGRAETFEVYLPSESADLSDLVPLAHAIADRMVINETTRLGRLGERVSCRPRCTACCNQLVLLTIPEVLHLAETVRTSPEASRLRARLRKRDEALQERGWIDELFDPTYSDVPPHIPIGVEYFRAGLVCPLLTDELCGVYEARPLACRTQSVTSRAELCVDPFDPAIRKISLPRSLSPILAYAAASLLGQEPCMIPLALFPRWLRDHEAIAKRRWHPKRLFSAFVQALG